MQEANDLYDALIAKYPNSPRAVFGKANALNKMAEEKQSNGLLEESITMYLKVLSLPDLPKALAILAGKACAERQSFRGIDAELFGSFICDFISFESRFLTKILLY